MNMSSSKVLSLRRHLSSQKTLPVMLKIFATGAVAVSDYGNLLLHMCSNNEYLKQNYGYISMQIQIHEN